MVNANLVYWAEYGVWRGSNKLRQRARVERLRRAGIRQTFFPKLGLVFVHIPRTAGTTLHEYFSKLEDACPSRAPSHDLIEALRWSLPHEHKHLKASIYRQITGAAAWESIYSFTLVRNPWDIMVSGYHWFLEKGPGFTGHLANALRVRRMAGFEEFLYSDLALAGALEPLESWFRLDGEDIVSQVGRFEAMRDELAKLRRNIDQAGTDARIPHHNRTNRSDYRSYYTPKMRESVAMKFRYVIERFEYEF